MPHTFQQQEEHAGLAFSKGAPKPQHGQKADRKAIKLKESRSFQPRPGH